MSYPTEVQLRGSARAMERWNASYVVEPSGCWRWTKSRTTAGYGHFHVFGDYWQAHRIAYILHGGSVPAGFEPDHLCRNRACVNPDHLEIVTRAVNVQRGVGAVLSQGQVDAIRLARRRGAGVRALARQYGVNPATVSRLVNGLTWPALPKPKAVAA